MGTCTITMVLGTSPTNKDENNPLMRNGSIIYAAIANPYSHKILAQWESPADKTGTASQVVASSILSQLTGDEGPPGCCAQYGSMKIFYTTCQARVRGSTGQF